MVKKPPDVFDRDREWEALDAFVPSRNPGTTLGLVYGRRRQGKTFLLETLVQQAGGLYLTALRQSSTQNLARMAEAYQRASGARGQVVFSDWEQAFDALLSMGQDATDPVLVVVDEFPYLLDAAPEIPSILQALLSPRSAAATRYRTRLVVCGSALSVMRRLLGGTAPLRGRASLELMVHPFGFRDAARFWGTADEPELSMMLHALVGGTPAYREMSGIEPPASLADFDAWAVAALLNPASAMFREGYVLLAEEPRITDAAVYFSVLSAISQGATRRGQIASAVGRAEGALAHPISVLMEAELIFQLPDAFKQRKTTYHIAEPMLRLHQVVIAPNEARLVRHHGTEVWAELADTVSSRIYGPHFEHLARTWCSEHAATSTLGGGASTVAPALVTCPAHKVNHELDVVVLESKAQTSDRVSALGEAKWRSTPMDVAQLERLEHVRDLLGARDAKLLCFSRSGFADKLVAMVRARKDVELVDMGRMYLGD